MKRTGKRMLSWLLSIVMVLSMLPVTAMAEGYDYVIGDTVDVIGSNTDKPTGTIPPRTCWDGPVKSVLATCGELEHTLHNDLCYGCGHANGHVRGCYDSAQWSMCSAPATHNHLDSITLDRSVVSNLSKLDRELVTQIQADFGSGLALLGAIGKTYCYEASEANRICGTHGISGTEHTDACYGEACPGIHSHKEPACYTYTWNLVNDANENGQNDAKESAWTVSFYAVDGDAEPFDTQPVLDGLTATAPESAPDRDYYTFVGWSPAPTATVITKDTEFVAQWTPNKDADGDGIADEEDTFQIVWKDEDGTILETDPDVGYGVTPTYDGKAPVKATVGDTTYTFAGWDPEVVPATENAEYTATYSSATIYEVTFDSDGGSAVAKQYVDIEKGEVVTKPDDPSWEGYTFAYWMDDSGAPYTFGSTISSDITLTAKWIKDTTVEASGSNIASIKINGAEESTATVDAQSTVTVEATAENGYYISEVQVTNVEQGEVPVVTNQYTSAVVTFTAVAEKDHVVTFVTEPVQTANIVVNDGEAGYYIGMDAATIKTNIFDAICNVGQSVPANLTATDVTVEVKGAVDWRDVTSTLGMVVITTAGFGGSVQARIVYDGNVMYTSDTSDAAKVTLVDKRNASSLVLQDATIQITSLANATVKADAIKSAMYDTVNSVGNGELKITDIKKYNDETGAYDQQVYSSANILNPGSTDLTEFGKYQVTMELGATAEYQKSAEASAILTIEDARTPTNIVLKEDVALTYSETLTREDVFNAVDAALMSNGQEIDGELTYTVSGINAGTQTVEVKFAGSDIYAASSASVEVTINKAPVTISVDNNVVKYGEAYDINVTTDPAIDTIQFVLGLDVAEMHLNGDQKPTGWKTELNLMLPGKLAELLPGSDISMSQLMDLFESDLVKGAMNLLGISQETMDGLFATMENLQEQFGDLTITVNGELPTNIGAYVVGAVTANANYETKAAAGYLVITPDGYKAELDWIVPDENGIVTLPAIKDGSYDLGAYVTKVHEGTVEEAEKELVDLFLGVDMEGNIVVTNDQNDLTVGAYSEISYILNWGNTMYYAEPIARAFVVVAEPVNVQFVDENGVINGDRLFTFDGEPHALDVKIFDVNNNDITDKLDAKNLTVTYYGVRSNGETYNSTTAPTHTGAYTAVATYVEKGADGTIQRAGVDVAVMIIKPIADAIVAVDNDHHIYDGNAYDVMQLVKSTPADAKVAVFTCGINLAGDFSEEGLSALSGQANIDFPAAADTVLKKYLPEVYENGLTAATVNTKIAQVKAELEKLGMNSDTLDGLTKLLAELPEGMVLTFKEQADVNPAAVGAYLVVGMIFDPDYVPEFGAGVLVITPEVQEAYLKFNVEDDNGIFTHEKIANADLGASAYDDAAFTKKNTDATSLVKNLFIGVDAEGKLVKTDDGKTLSDGIYIQIAYIGELNGRYYAEPISRPMIVAMDVADVDILDGNGNENYAQVYTYGEEIQMTISVDGKVAPVDGLTIKYIGSDTTVDGWYCDEAPTDAGVYTVVAIYTEKDGSKLVKAGGAMGVLIIEPADVEVGLTDAEYVYDGNEYFATITNDTLDYVTVAIDRENNIAYVNMPEDTAEHVDRIITMLPAETEARLRTFLEKYESFDGDVQTSVLKEELTLIIDKMVGLDMTSEAEALAKQVADKVIADLEKNEDVNATIQQIKSELSAIEDAIRGEIPDEIEASLEQYIRDIITVNGGIDVDVDQVKTEIKALIAEIEGQLPADAAAELDKLVNELVAAVKNSVDVDELETEITQILNDLETLAADEAKTLAKYVIGAIYSQVDMTEIESLLEQVVTKVEARGYVDYLKNMVNMIAGVYGGEIDTSSVESALNTLITKVEEKVASGKIDADDLEGMETYVDQVLVSLKSVVDQIPKGKVVFGKNPSDVGEYDCYAMNISANYKWEFVEATLIIYEETYTVSFDANGGTGTMDDVTGVAGTYTLPANGFTAPAGKQFKGWATAADGDVISGTTITVSANITLYAIWETSGAGGTGGGAGGGAGGAVGGGGGGAILDTQNHFSYMVGFADGTLQPYGNVTRGQVATIFFRLLTDEAREKYWSQTNNYSDCSENLWCNNAISTLSNMGIIDGYEDGTFRPYAKITRAQFAKIAVGFFETTKNDYQGYFSDVPANAWFSEYVEAAVNAGLIQGFQDGTYRPNDYITRAQACVIVNRALDRKPDMDYLLDEDEMITWTDCTPDHWFYADMMEATNSHDYEMVRVSGKTVENWTKKLEQRDWTALEKSWSTANSAPGGEVVR